MCRLQVQCGAVDSVAVDTLLVYNVITSCLSLSGPSSQVGSGGTLRPGQSIAAISAARLVIAAAACSRNMRISANCKIFICCWCLSRRVPRCDAWPQWPGLLGVQLRRQIKSSLYNYSEYRYRAHQRYREFYEQYGHYGQYRKYGQYRQYGR